MANLNNNKTALLVLILSILLFIAIVESRAVFHIGLVKAESGPTCDSVYGVRSGDTCFDVAQNFKLSSAEFDTINPNLNCTSLFVGQWLCVEGTA